MLFYLLDSLLGDLPFASWASRSKGNRHGGGFLCVYNISVPGSNNIVIIWLLLPCEDSPQCTGRGAPADGTICAPRTPAGAAPRAAGHRPRRAPPSPHGGGEGAAAPVRGGNGMRGAAASPPPAHGAVPAARLPPPRPRRPLRQLRTPSAYAKCAGAGPLRQVRCVGTAGDRERPGQHGRMGTGMEHLCCEGRLGNRGCSAW